ncbi:MAG: hypothetical protein A2X48_20420 [Lentisphaerae bacterium GWF2_49_21]|nr:MAG: hypothetical protein A2X48_20420 [Lentisphaerae bacterium GWF2_49_21]
MGKGMKNAFMHFLVYFLVVIPPNLLLAEGTTDEESFPFNGVRYIHRHIDSPRKIDMHLVIIDLNVPGIQIKVTGQRKGGNIGETELERTREFVRKNKAQIGINGGFFDNSMLTKLSGVTKLVSLSVSEGVQVSPWSMADVHNHGINFGEDNKVTFIGSVKAGGGFDTEPKVKLYNSVAGNARLIRNGAMNVKGGDQTYPQTAIGHTADNHLILFVSDGRQPGFSEGMSYEDVANILKEFGAVDAIALDGGGSATLVMTNKDAVPGVINRPSDGTERKVGSNIAILIPFPVEVKQNKAP